MAILIRTSDVPPEELRDAWRAVVCDTLGPLDFRSDPDIPLRGEIAAGQLGPVNVGRVETSTPHSVYRTPGLIRRDSPELYRVALTMSGQACLLQDGRTARLAARRVTGEHAADAHPRLHRAAPRRLRPGSRPGGGRALHFGALPVPAVRGAGDHGGRLDQAPAPRALPRGPGRPGPGRRASERRRGAVGPAGFGSPQPVVQANLRAAACRI